MKLNIDAPAEGLQVPDQIRKQNSSHSLGETPSDVDFYQAPARGAV
jgi:hypothetical protein